MLSGDGNNHEYNENSQHVRFEFGVGLAVSEFVRRHDSRVCLWNFAAPRKFSHCGAEFSTAAWTNGLVRGVNGLVHRNQHDDQHGHDINSQTP